MHGYDALVVICHVVSHFNKRVSAKNIFKAVLLEFGAEGVLVL